MHIAIAGPGALGCLFVSLLAKQYNTDRLWLLDHNRERANLLNQQGIIYESGRDLQRTMIPVAIDPRVLKPVDIILFCVKSYSLNSCLQFCLPLLSPRTLLVFLQNGIGHLDIQERLQLPTSPAFISSSEGATLVAPGHVLHTGCGTTQAAFLHQPAKLQQQQLAELTQSLQAAGLAIAHSLDIRSQLWAKLFINAGINPLTALYQRSNGQLLTSCAARSRIKNIVQEAEAVARACGIAVTTDPLKATFAVCTKTARNISSMLQDRRNKRPTEIDSINGAVVQAGKRVGMATPFNEEVVQQIKAMEAAYNQDEHKDEK